MSSIITKRFIKCHNKLREDNLVRSSRQFALSLDYLPQSLSEILKGRRDVTIELLRKSVELYKINPVYIYTGEGPMFMSEEDHKSFRVLTIVTNAQDDERIVHVPVPAQAGYAGEMTNPTFISNLPTYTLPDYKYKVGTHRSFDVAGDSMEPTLFEGDKVIRFELVGAEQGDWIEWHPDESVPASFLSGLGEPYEIERYQQLSENWFLVRYRS